MHNHNDKNYSSMIWMMLLCLVPLVILLFTGGKLFSRGYLWPILIGGFLVAHFWIMLKSYRSHDSDHAVPRDKSEDKKNDINDEHKN